MFLTCFVGGAPRAALSPYAWACPCDMYLFTSLIHSVGGAPRAASSPGHVGLSLWHVSLLVYVFSLSCWGRPLGCIIPKPLGPDPGVCLSLHLSKLICFFMLNLLEIIACSIDTYLWSRSLWHGACERVLPCNADKSEWLSSGRGSPARRHLTRPSVPQSLSRSNQRLAGNRNNKSCFSS